MAVGEGTPAAPYYRMRRLINVAVFTREHLLISQTMLGLMGRGLKRGRSHFLLSLQDTAQSNVLLQSDYYFLPLTISSHRPRHSPCDLFHWLLLIPSCGHPSLLFVSFSLSELNIFHLYKSCSSPTLRSHRAMVPGTLNRHKVTPCTVGQGYPQWVVRHIAIISVMSGFIFDYNCYR